MDDMDKRLIKRLETLKKETQPMPMKNIPDAQDKYEEIEIIHEPIEILKKIRLRQESEEAQNTDEQVSDVDDDED